MAPEQAHPRLPHDSRLPQGQQGAIEKTFREFNRFCYGEELFSKDFVSIDGSKFKAVNAKDRNFTLNKLDDRIACLDRHIACYMEELVACDEEEGRKLSREELEIKLEGCKGRKELYEGYRKQLEQSGEKQMSLTDPDARLMKANEGFSVGYNAQVAVDAGSHMIAGSHVTNSPTDHGQITGVAGEVKNEYGVDILEATADKGYESPEDHANALASGIVSNVIRRDESCTEEVKFDYREAEITGGQRASTVPEDMKACLEAGVIPDAYKDILSGVKVCDVKACRPDVTDAGILKMSDKQMRAKAAQGCFIRDAERNLVYCPQGEILRQKSVKRNGMIRHCNKLACKRCRHRCTSADFKEADFNKDTLIHHHSKRLQTLDRLPWGCRRRATSEASPENRCEEGGKLRASSGRKKDGPAEVPLRASLRDAQAVARPILLPVERLRQSHHRDGHVLPISYNMQRAINKKGVPALLAALR